MKVIKLLWSIISTYPITYYVIIIIQITYFIKRARDYFINKRERKTRAVATCRRGKGAE